MPSSIYQFFSQLLAQRPTARQLLAFWKTQPTGASADAVQKKADTLPQTIKPWSAISTGSSESAQALQDRSLQQEILADRKFSLAEAIGREGGSFMKGESAVPRPLRATTQINQFITSQLNEPMGALSTTLFQWAATDIRVSRQLDTPLVALAQIVEGLLNEPTTFCEFFRQVAIAHSQLTGDRPYFQQLHQPSHPEATHTHTSIRQQLTALLQVLQAPQPYQP